MSLLLVAPLPLDKMLGEAKKTFWKHFTHGRETLLV
jgi:hypothetical protein